MLCSRTPSTQHLTFTTKYNKWQTVERSTLFQSLRYLDVSNLATDDAIPKLSSTIEKCILGKLRAETRTLDYYARKSGRARIYYTRKLSGFVQILDFVPEMYDSSGRHREPSELKLIHFESETARNAFLAFLNSSLFYWMLTIYSDCRNLNRREVHSVPFNLSKANNEILNCLASLSEDLMTDFRLHSRMLSLRYEDLGNVSVQSIVPKFSKPIIDEIDRTLAPYFGFTDEELDFVINCDIKYRMGQDGMVGDDV